MSLGRPARGPETQPFATRQLQDGQPHAGTDFGFSDAAGKTYPDALAAESGTVLFAGDTRTLGWPNPWYFNPDFDRSDDVDSSAGNAVVLGHRDGVTTYCHLESIDVAKGAPVARGQRIGTIGATGNAAGKHLHFEWIPYPFNFGTATYGRARPNFAPTISPQGTTTGDTFMANLTEAEQRELLTKTRELHRDYAQGIPGVRSDGDSFNVVRRMASKLGVAIDEAARKAKYGKK